MEIFNKIKNAKKQVTLAIAFACSMLISSYLTAGHESANMLIIVQICLYMTVVNLLRLDNQCDKQM